MHEKLKVLKPDLIPPKPQGGIPKQRLPGFIRWPIRVLVVPFVVLDNFLQKLLHKIIPPPYKLKGGCQKSGNCCHFIHMGWPKQTKALSFLSKLSVLWNTEILGFYFRDFDYMEKGGKLNRVMSCRYLKKDGTCNHYYTRPLVCRQWPKLFYFYKPTILRGCGYRVEKRKTLFITFLSWLKRILSKKH